MNDVRQHDRPDEALAREIAELGPWFHNLHLPGGVTTAPDHWLGDFPRYKWEQLAPCLPNDLNGWRALDIGCNAGFYSFALAERGARVTGLDSDARYLRQAEWARERLGLDGVDFRRGQVYDLAGSDERYDLVLFMGVLYHLRYPMLALDTVARLKPRLMVFQSLTHGGERLPPENDASLDFATRGRLDHPDWPKLAFIETAFADDPTNWWVPNHAAIEAMLRAAGFAIEAHPGHELYLCRTATDAPPVPLSEDEYASAIGIHRR